MSGSGAMYVFCFKPSSQKWGDWEAAPTWQNQVCGFSMCSGFSGSTSPWKSPLIFLVAVYLDTFARYYCLLLGLKQTSESCSMAARCRSSNVNCCCRFSILKIGHQHLPVCTIVLIISLLCLSKWF